MFYSVKELIQSAKESRRDAWELILMDDANERNVSQKESFEKMRYMWHSMKKSVESYDPNLVSPSGLSGKNGKIYSKLCKRRIYRKSYGYSNKCC